MDDLVFPLVEQLRGDYASVSSAPTCRGAPQLLNRPLSLLEMLALHETILQLLEMVRFIRNHADNAASGQNLSGIAKTWVSPSERDIDRQYLVSVKDICTKHELETALVRIRRIEEFLNSLTCTYSELARHYRTLYENIEDDLRKRRFWEFSLAKEKVGATYKDIPFKDGPDLIQARYDWSEATRAYGFEMNTACVMHSMRVAELGLRTLGKHLKIELKRAIEFEDWRPILVAVEAKLKSLENEPRTEERTRDLNFYSDAGKTLLYFKNIWRDGSAHAREIYDENDAKKALDNVFDFMKLLAEKLDQVS